ncbi:hypothetical protein MPHO_35530 [Mycolicibacterium phocaicum]|nr:hypothetical protein MPHO_35530 [Mycolicibacterium phocaicum]
MVVEEGEQVGLAVTDPRTVQSVADPQFVGVGGFEPAEHLPGATGGGPISSQRWKWRSRVDSEGAQPVAVRRMRATWAVVRDGFSRFNEAASSSTPTSVRVASRRGSGTRASNPPAR